MACFASIAGQLVPGGTDRKQLKFLDRITEPERNPTFKPKQHQLDIFH